MPMRALIARANRASVVNELRIFAEAPFRLSPSLTADQGYRRQNNNIPRSRVKALYSAGRIAIEIVFSLLPETWSTKGLSANSYFMVLRMPSQSVAPEKALGLMK
jgi:hypothetical protein